MALLNSAKKEYTSIIQNELPNKKEEIIVKTNLAQTYRQLLICQVSEGHESRIFDNEASMSQISESSDKCQEFKSMFRYLASALEVARETRNKMRVKKIHCIVRDIITNFKDQIFAKIQIEKAMTMMREIQTYLRAFDEDTQKMVYCVEIEVFHKHYQLLLDMRDYQSIWSLCKYFLNSSTEEKHAKYKNAYFVYEENKRHARSRKSMLEIRTFFKGEQLLEKASDNFNFESDFEIMHEALENFRLVSSVENNQIGYLIIKAHYKAGFILFKYLDKLEEAKKYFEGGLSLESELTVVEQESWLKKMKMYLEQIEQKMGDFEEQKKKVFDENDKKYFKDLKNFFDEDKYNHLGIRQKCEELFKKYPHKQPDSEFFSKYKDLNDKTIKKMLKKIISFYHYQNNDDLTEFESLYFTEIHTIINDLYNHYKV